MDAKAHSAARSDREVFYALGLGTFAVGTEGFMIAAVLPTIARDLAVSIEATGLLVTVFSVVYALSSPVLTVLTGSMSLVGPRPPLPEESAAYGPDIRRRLLVKPGLTGLWQISGRSDLPWEEAVRLDLRYVEDWSLALDTVILWKTLRAVLYGQGAY